MNILLFAGTTEGRDLAGRLRALPVRATICVATDYGSELLAEFSDRFAIRTGRLDAAGMRRLLAEMPYDCVVDATHPYAAAASAAIRAAADAAGVPRLRLLREESPAGAGAHYVASAAAAAEALARLPGNVLLATGAKDLSAFAAVPDFARRCYPRVLPTAEALARCAALGFRRRQVIAMQGPFSRELNLAILREFAIAIMVTKDGGTAGGFPEKMAAAAEAGVRVLVIGRPPEDAGFSLAGIVDYVQTRLEAEA